MGIATFRVAHAHNPNSKRYVRRATPNPSCKTGGFYQAPTNQQSVDSLQPLTIKWDNTCLDTTNADIYLYAPSADRSRIAVWQNVVFSMGTVTVDLMPRWWNSSSSINLQLSIVPSGQAPFQSLDMPAGPIFTATYSIPSSGKPPAAADTSINTSPIINMSDLSKPKGITPGAKAAAVLLPLLFLICATVVYIRWQRKKSGQKSKRFSVAVDKRMSTISTDWKSVTAAGANAAIRNSMAVPGNRNSSFSFGPIRPSSIAVGDDNNQPGVGVAVSPNQMSQFRGTGVGLRNPSSLATSTERVSRVSFADTVNRQSRVSFANDPRPSTDSSGRRTKAFQNDYVPPVPSLPPTAVTTSSTSPASPTDDGSSDSVGALSPRQTQGPLTLTPEDIRAKVSSSRARSASSASALPPPTPKRDRAPDDMDDVLPALSMMRTDQGGEELLLPSPPPAAIASPSSPPPRMMSPTMPMPTMPMPTSVMSPDEMLRAYAERRKTSSGAPISHPMSPTLGGAIPLPMSPPPVAQQSSNNSPAAAARQLFGPTGLVGSGGGNTKQKAHFSYTGARYEIGDEDDAYGGTA